MLKFKFKVILVIKHPDFAPHGHTQIWLTYKNKWRGKTQYINEE